MYHVTSRGNARADIFLSDADRQTFLDTLAGTIEKYNWLCHAFCLLDNYYHTIIETPDPNLSLGMRQLNGVYTQAFNRAHQRVGHVFQGRYKAILAEKGSNLNFVMRMQELLEEKPEIKETPRAQRYPGRPPFVRLFADIGVENKQHRNKRLLEAHVTYGYTLKEIADCLGIHYTTVSRAIAGIRKK